MINKLKFSLSNPPFISFIIGIFALLFAFYLQYILGYEPCILVEKDGKKFGIITIEDMMKLKLAK